MARIRTVKPEFFAHEDLASCSPHARLLAIALLQLADRLGRMRWLTMQVHGHAFPYEEDLDVGALADELEAIGYLRRYRAQGKTWAVIPTFVEHQRITGSETRNMIRTPEPPPLDTARNATASGVDTTRIPETDTTRIPETDTDGKPGSGIKDQGTRNNPPSSCARAREGDSGDSTVTTPSPDFSALERVRDLLGVMTLPDPLWWAETIPTAPDWTHVESLAEWARKRERPAEAFRGAQEKHGWRKPPERKRANTSPAGVPRTGPGSLGWNPMAALREMVEEHGLSVRGYGDLEVVADLDAPPPELACDCGLDNCAGRRPVMVADIGWVARWRCAAYAEAAERMTG